MTSTDDRIHEAASKNVELLAILARTDYAKPALKQQNEYVRDLEKASAANHEHVTKMTAALAKEQKDHQKYDKSVVRRFAFKATGQKEKFEIRADKEEREYFEAVNAEHLAKQEGQNLAQQLEAAKRVQRELEPVAAERERAQQELDNLYNSIFAGQTPAFPEEDQHEGFVRQVWEDYQKLESHLRWQQQVQQVLGQAQPAMNAALGSVDSALSASTFDMFGGGAMADYMERSALGQAEAATHEVFRLNDQALSMSDAGLQRLPQVNIAQGSMLGDVLFDSTFSDYKFHQKIKATKEDLQRVAVALKQNQGAIEQRSAGLRQEMSEASQRLEDARTQLQKVREGIFSRSVGQA